MIYLLIRDFEVSIIYLFISSHSELNTYKKWKCISSVRVGTGNLVRRRNPLKEILRRSLADYSTFISYSIECENVKIIRITRAKVEFGLRFKDRLIKDLL